MHLFGHNCDHDYYFGLPRKGERDAQSSTRCSTEHHSLVRAVPRTNRTSSIARNPIPCATSSTGERPTYEPWQLWRSFVLRRITRWVILAAPFWQTAHCDLRRFHQQETHDRTPLFGDVPQSPPIPAGFF